MKRISSLPLFAVAIIAALLLGLTGSIGSAVAKPLLTTSKVKAIATKVVNQAAPNLSVKSAQTAATATQATNATNATTATNATNATNLNGKPAAAYETPSLVFNLPVQAATTSRSYIFDGVPAGTYLVSYSVFLATTITTGESNCQLYSSQSSTVAEAWSYGANHYLYLTNNGTASLTVGASAPRLLCQGSTPWTIGTPTLGGFSKVTFVRIDAPSTGSVTTSQAGSDAPASTN